MDNLVLTHCSIIEYNDRTVVMYKMEGQVGWSSLDLD
jgi:hypothetical protein